MLHDKFVGREKQLVRLDKIMADVIANNCRVAFIMGGPGIGKTQLALEFAKRTQARLDKVLFATGNCNAHTGAVAPYLPFLDLLAQLMGNVDKKLGEGGLTELGARRLKEAMNVSISALIQNAPDLIGTFIPSGELIGKGVLHIAKKAGLLPTLEKQIQKDPEQLAEMDKDKLLDQYTELLGSLAEHYPIILILDDLQWADEPSIALLQRILQKLSNSQIMLLGTFRSVNESNSDESIQISWKSIFNETKIDFGDVLIDLEKTSEEEKLSFVSAYLQASPNKFPEHFSQELFNKTSGHPLFLIELLQWLVEREKIWHDGDGYWITNSEIDWTMLPSRVEGAVAERIAQLEDNLRELLAIASVEGVNFSVPVLAAICKQSEYSILKQLSGKLDKHYHLIHESTIQEIAGNWICQYRFCSAIFQQYLYGELSRREKMILHGRIASALEDLYGDQVESIAIELALHYELAGEHFHACRYYNLTGMHSMKVGAYLEASKHFSTALDILDSLSENDENNLLRIEIYIPYCNALRVVHGWRSPEVAKACNQARRFCKKVGAVPATGPFLFNIWASWLVNLDLDKAKEVAIDNIQLGDEIDSNEIRIQGLIALGNTEYWLGEFESCNANMKKASELLAKTDIPEMTKRYGQDMRLFAHMFEAFSYWKLGNVKRADACASKLLHIVGSENDRFGLTIALQALSWHAFHVNDTKKAKAGAHRMVELSRKIDNRFYEAIGLLFWGWAESMLGDEKGLMLIEQGFEKLDGDGSNNIMYSIYVLCHVSALKAFGKTNEASAIIKKAIPIIRKYKCLAYLPQIESIAEGLHVGLVDTENTIGR